MDVFMLSFHKIFKSLGAHGFRYTILSDNGVNEINITPTKAQSVISRGDLNNIVRLDTLAKRNLPGSRSND